MLNKQGTLTTTKTDLYITPINKEAYVKTIKLMNKNTIPVLVLIYSFVDGVELIFDTYEIPAGDSIVFSTYPLFYKTGEGLKGQANTIDSINYFILGEEVSI